MFIPIKIRKLLFTSALNGDIEGCKQALYYGAQINDHNVNILNKGGKSPLHLAAHAGQYETCKYLIENGADVNIACVDGKTPLHESAKQNHITVCVLLIDNGADIDHQDYNHRTASDYINDLKGIYEKKSLEKDIKGFITNKNNNKARL